MTLRIAGGSDSNRLGASLFVEGKPVASAVGCDVEFAGRRIFDLRPHRGKVARFYISDASRDGWGHLVVDDLEQWVHE
jgi:hypothetical protein